MIRTTGLTHGYRSGDQWTPVLRDCTLSIGHEYVLISGPSGSGKSTLLGLLALLLRPTEGTIYWGDIETTAIDDEQRAHLRRTYLGFIFQDFRLLPELTVAQNVLFSLDLIGDHASDRARRVKEQLDQVGLGHRGSHYPDQLSGGEQQRVAIARALIKKPTLIFADEPTGNLDKANAELVMSALQDAYRSGSTVILVSHNDAHQRDVTRVIRLDR